jgi:hypothetical protein
MLSVFNAEFFKLSIFNAEFFKLTIFNAEFFKLTIFNAEFLLSWVSFMLDVFYSEGLLCSCLLY